MRLFYPKIALVFLLFLAIPNFAQETCVEISNTSESLLNLRLGMTVDEVNKQYKFLKIKIKNNNDYRFFQNYIDKNPPAELNGVRAIYLRFFEKKIYQIEVFWEENKYSSDLKLFTQIVSQQLNLPTEKWVFAHRQAVVNCGENTLKIDYQLNPRIELTNDIILKNILELEKNKKD